ncbi:protein FAR1-RELATED SEQUENCE 5-like [Salvia miltiorrhiza]|uniref:protein FAR1-RELATED SEQUENCE 5-like n=1 Tax=Salvia miltiorrhiza TaxID=226208 RepID=UPI0025AD212D|nr:protein FAR1-RELATED SEQUENCE 5-like [Salvia miltiorrhiza]
MSSNDPPGVIITDQDAAIARAILEKLPRTLHRFCLWHILNKFPEKMNSLLYHEHYHKLVHIIKESESGEEFEHRWMEVMESTELKSNEWLSDLYTIRHRWVPTYVKDVFAAGISSSQRAESNHSFFKRYVNHKNSLIDFIMRFNRALVNQRHEELVANHTDINERPRLITGLLMENQMTSIYTKTIFLLFQKELQQSMLYLCTVLSSTDAYSKYKVKRFELGETFNRERELTYYTSSDSISCSCRLFEFEGYPCRHMLCWMRVQQIMMLPDKYIPQRWTKLAKSTVLYEHIGFAKGQSFTSRRGALSHMAMDIVDKCSLTEASSNFLMIELEKLRSKVKDFDIGGNTSKPVNESDRHESVQSVQDPNLVRAKGCGKRLKSSKEKAMSQSNRNCSICSQNGHDKRTCPRINKKCYN